MYINFIGKLCHYLHTDFTYEKITYVKKFVCNMALHMSTNPYIKSVRKS